MLIYINNPRVWKIQKLQQGRQSVYYLLFNFPFLDIRKHLVIQDSCVTQVIQVLFVILILQWFYPANMRVEFFPPHHQCHFESLNSKPGKNISFPLSIVQGMLTPIGHIFIIYCLGWFILLTNWVSILYLLIYLYVVIIGTLFPTPRMESCVVGRAYLFFPLEWKHKYYPVLIYYSFFLMQLV